MTEVSEALIAIADSAPIGNEARLVLREAADLIEALSSLPTANSRKLWLWRNFVDGRPEYWAFDNPYPCYEGGDPMTLGEPCGWALFKPSANGRPDVADETVEAAMLPATSNSRDEWQDIETAPKDGRWIDAVGGSWRQNVRWNGVYWESMRDGFNLNDPMAETATHWRPLPAPPGQEPRGTSNSLVREALSEARELISRASKSYFPTVCNQVIATIDKALSSMTDRDKLNKAKPK